MTRPTRIRTQTGLVGALQHGPHLLGWIDQRPDVIVDAVSFLDAVEQQVVSTDGEIAVLRTGDVGTAERDALDAEAARLATWLGDVRIKWRYPTRLTKALA